MSLSPVPPNHPNHIGGTGQTEVDGCSPNNNNNNVNEANGHRKMNPRSLLPKLSPNPSRRNNLISDNYGHYARSPTTSIDTRLNEWLIKHNIDITSKNIILGELYTYEDFVYELEKTDLHRIGLK